MRSRPRLTTNAILYISLGFQQTCALQVLDVRQGQDLSLEMILHDGLVYAGAIYDYSSVTMLLVRRKQGLFLTTESEKVRKDKIKMVPSMDMADKCLSNMT
jgi:hypothetical protein